MSEAASTWGIFLRCAELGRAVAYFEIAPTLGLKPQASTNLHITSVNPMPNAQVCYFNNVWFMF